MTEHHTITPTSSTEPVLERLARVEGFDLARGLRNLGGHEGILIRALGRFTQTYRNGLPELTQPDQPESAASWTLLSNGACGACATIGATQMQSLLQEFQQALKAAPDTQLRAPQALQVNQALLNLVAQLSQALAPASPD
jgi:HPt (histidine-containing phosphotransfer) domain-containing protein